MISEIRYERDDRAPAVCTAPRRERSARASWVRNLFGRVREVHRVTEGYDFRFPEDGDADVFAEVAEFVERESSCCPYIGFQLWAEDGHVVLRATARSGARRALARYARAARGTAVTPRSPGSGRSDRAPRGS